MLYLQISTLIAVTLTSSLVVGQERPTPIALTHVTVIDCTGAAAQPEMTVVITGNRISQLGPSDDLILPEGARVIDASGKYMIPGLWDMHVHATANSAGIFLANGVTGRRVMWGTELHLKQRGQAGDDFGPYDGAEWNKSGVRLENSPVLPYLRTNIASPVLDGPRVTWPGLVPVETPAAARDLIIRLQGAGYDFLKVYSRLPRDVYFAIAEEATKRKMRFAGHVPYAVTAKEASNAGQASIEHLTEIYVACSSEEANLRELPPHELMQRNSSKLTRRTYDRKKADALFAVFAKNNTWMVPTLTVLRRRAMYSESEILREDPRLRFVKRDLVSVWLDQLDRRADLPDSHFDRLAHAFAQDIQTVGQMHKAGVRILAGTDTGNAFCLPGFGVHDELEFLVQAGLTPIEALQSATKGPAEYLDRSTDIGTVEVGKLADLVLLDADPLRDINNVRKVSSVVLAGRYFSRRQLDEILAVNELEHSVLALAEFFSEQRLQALAANELITRISRLRIQDAIEPLRGFRVRRHVGARTGQDVTLLFPKMSNLKELFLNNTSFNDIGMNRIRNLVGLETLELDSTNITDSGLTHLQRLTKLRKLRLSDTMVTDSSLQGLASLPGLVHLSLDGTRVTAGGLDLLSGCVGLEHLEIDHVQLNENTMKSFGTLKNLKVLRLSGTPVTDAGLRHLMNLQNLSRLSLADTDITDEGVTHLHQLQNLKHLDLTNTAVSRQAVARIAQALPECTVLVSEIPRLTIKLLSPHPNKFFKSGESVLLSARPKAIAGAVVGHVDYLVDDDKVATNIRSPYDFTWKGAEPGFHVATVQVYDQTGKLVDSQRAPFCVGFHGVQVPVASSEDDVEEQEDGSMYFDSSDLELTRDGRRGKQLIGLRFINIPIPPRAKITRAYIQFTAAGAGKPTTELSIRGERSPNAAPFYHSKHDLSTRPTSDTSVNWSPPEWTQKDERSEKQRTPDLSQIIQKIVSQDEWKSGNAVSFVVTGRGYRNAVSCDGNPEMAPTLHIEYEL